MINGSHISTKFDHLSIDELNNITSYIIDPTKNNNQDVQLLQTSKSINKSVHEVHSARKFVDLLLHPHEYGKDKGKYSIQNDKIIAPDYDAMAEIILKKKWAKASSLDFKYMNRYLDSILCSRSFTDNKKEFFNDMTRFFMGGLPFSTNHSHYKKVNSEIKNVYLDLKSMCKDFNKINSWSNIDFAVKYAIECPYAKIKHIGTVHNFLTSEFNKAIDALITSKVQFNKQQSLSFIKLFEHIGETRENPFYALELLIKPFKSDEEFIISALNINSAVLTCLTLHDINSSRKIAMKAVRINGKLLTRLNKNFQNDYEIAHNAVKSDGSVYKNLSKKLKSNISIIKAALTQNVSVLHVIPMKIRKALKITFSSIEDNYKKANKVTVSIKKKM